MAHATHAHPIPPPPPVAAGWCLRWTRGSSRWRHVHDGGFDTRAYEIGPLDETAAKAFVVAHHYSHSYPAARLRYGLWTRGGELVGVAVLSVPASKAVLTNFFPQLVPYQESLELGRFVLLDSVPANGESCFLAEVWRRAAAAGLRGVVSFADATPRTTSGGRRIFVGHWGEIYRSALGARYAGQATARTVLLLPDGTCLNARSQQKIPGGERGGRGVEAMLVQRWGVRPRRADEAPAAWLAEVLPPITRPLAHPGNHRYLFALGSPSERRQGRAAIEAVLAARPAVVAARRAWFRGVWPHVAARPRAAAVAWLAAATVGPLAGPPVPTRPQSLPPGTDPWPAIARATAATWWSEIGATWTALVAATPPKKRGRPRPPPAHDPAIWLAGFSSGAP